MARLVTLIENTTEDKSMLTEHGLSFYLENKGSKFLIDTGQSGKFIKNAVNMGIDIKDVDYVIITHNHYDHIGGLLTFLQYNSKAIVYIRRAAFESQYLRLGASKKVLSIDEKIYSKYKDRFIYLDKDIVLDNIHLLSLPLPDSRYISKDKDFYKTSGDKYIKDTFEHELFIVVEGAKLDIISSCSHTGIINIVNRVREIFYKPINNVIGGFHFAARGISSINCDKEFVYDNAKGLADIEGMIYTGHCTGIKAYRLMREVLGDKMNYLYTCKIINL